MKRFLLIIAACFPAIGLLAADVEPMSTDTVIRLENKRIVVKDNGERMKVKVYELTEEGDSIDREMIFEGTSVKYMVLRNGIVYGEYSLNC